MLPQITLGYLIILAIAYGLSLLETTPIAGQFVLGSILVLFIGLIVKASRQ
jgi:hypothetical protein